MEIIRQAIAYKTAQGKCPFREWHVSLEDAVKQSVADRVRRLCVGNAGDCKAVGEGVYEMRFHQGAGYRVYFAYDGNQIVLLLVGGQKSTQGKDIKIAKFYWEDYHQRSRP